MNTAAYSFVRRYITTVALALVPVVLTAFLSIPLSLGGHPGEPRTAAALTSWHMT